jgi:tRNA-specific 2-thiouridylase
MQGKNIDLTRYGYRKIKFNGAPARIVVGMSGGVDSSVAAYILKWQGYDVVGLFMKNWEEQDEAGHCTAEDDFNDVKRVCSEIGIPYYGVNFAKEYMDNVFAEFLQGLKKGWTPNPDILCNREVKFKPFLQKAEQLGADYIATGHYAKIIHNGRHILCKAADGSKDQSYFLCGLAQEQLARVIFPLADIKKTAVREIAGKLGLINAEKKDSTGICFIGERKIKQFLTAYLGSQKGEIRTLDGEIVGTHDGLMYYTIGQRKGMAIGGYNGKTDTARWFAVRKDIPNNILYVSNGDCRQLYSRSLIISDFNEIKGFGGGAAVGIISPAADSISGGAAADGGGNNRNASEAEFSGAAIGVSGICGAADGVSQTAEQCRCFAKIRYRQPDQACTAVEIGGGKVRVIFDKPQRAVTLGQWCVLYDGDEVLGGGIITEVTE